ncbi:MAG: DUF3078 domain-containing protein [Fibrobacteres bacterium]|nr:DUF3078 domain-containing protein [Fibrobacterota bacterium]
MNTILILSALLAQQQPAPVTAPDPSSPAPTAALAASDSAKPVASPWKNEAQTSLNLASAYFDQWAPGGEDNLSWTIKLAARAERDGSDWNWLSKGSAEFGQIKLGDRALRKTTDEIKAETMLSRKLSKYLNPFVAAGLQTQFYRGYKYPADSLPRLAVSDPLDPLYLSQSAGVGSKPVEWFQTRLGAALREVRTDYFTTYSDDPTTSEVEDWKVEPGLEWVSEYKQTIAKNLLLQSTLTTFTNFKGADEIVLVWTNGATFQFTSFININASGELHRDLQQADAWQWKHVLALGLTYNLL